jgi:quinolinate synthase
MKKTQLEDVLNCMQNDKFEITLDENIIKAANKSLDKMMELSFS